MMHTQGGKFTKHGISTCVVNEAGEACKRVHWGHNATPLCFDSCEGKIVSLHITYTHVLACYRCLCLREL